ncbi:MAG: tRNA (adenine(22)-N(1))-methyltransferase TrmK, partial [Proteocatella sp.]
SQLIDEKLEYIRHTDVEIIVQPVQSPESVRKYFCKNGFSIKQEKLAKADGRIYHIIKARPDKESGRESNELSDDIDYELGRLIIKDRSLENQLLLEELVTYKLKEQYKIKGNLESISEDELQEKYRKRYNEVIIKIESLNRILVNIALN